MTAADAREEWDLVDSSSVEADGLVGFHEWYQATKLGDAYEFHQTRIRPQLKHFCKVTMARLGEAIRAELEKEAAAA